MEWHQINQHGSLFSLIKVLARTIEVLPSNKGRIPRKNLNQYQCRKSGNPFSIACCQSSSSFSSSHDEPKPYICSDWRAFRARLIAKDRVLKQVEPSLMVDQDTIGDKWAHTIHEPEKGCLLIATEKLNGVHIFQRTVILLLSTGPINPTGVILNRALLMSIKEMGSSALDISSTFSDRPLFFGGPSEEGLFLVTPKGGNDSVRKSGVFDEVMKGLYFGMKESVGFAAEMVKREMVRVEDFKFFNGYCTWEREQLREEIRDRYWTLAACSLGVIGLATEDNIMVWDEIIGLLGPRKLW